MSVNIKDNIMTPDLQRTYEISLWTLQDSFIAVLGDSSSQTRGYIENPVMKLSNDGTQELDFSLPMYIDDGITRRKSNIWSQMTNAVTIAGMRKIKVVFNKGTEDEKVYEFIITTVTDTHESNKPACEIHCEGLAFHELGKIGYKISLSIDDFYADEEAEWDRIDSEQRENAEQNESPMDDIYEQIETTIQPTVNYWSEKIGLTLYPNDPSEILNSSIWYYRIIMDWSAYEHGYARATDKIYEESYVSSYEINENDEIAPQEYEQFREKTRYVTASASNIYNLTQEIAKTFGIYCRYDYIHDENYHIIGRIVTYYNNFIDERNRLEFTYPYTSKRITRENDCTDLVTKMYVNTVESDQSESGVITIMDNPVNPTGEDYLLNFDYLYAIDTITDEQYAAVKTFSAEVRELNDAILAAQDIIVKRETVEVTYSAQLQVLGNTVKEDSKQLDTYNAYAANLTNGTGKLSRSGATRATLFIVDNKVTFIDQGIVNNSKFQIYDDEEQTVTLTEVHINDQGYIDYVMVEPRGKSMVFAAYEYYPKLYYDEVIDLYGKRLARDEQQYALLDTKITALRAEIEAAGDQLSSLLEEKNQLIKDFEALMGPALREGNWTPEDYANMASAKYQFLSTIITKNDTDVWPVNDTYKIIKSADNGPIAKLIWDTNLDYNEQDNKYKNLDETETYYYILPLTGNKLTELINFYANSENEGIPFGVLWYDSAYASHNRPSPIVKFFSIGSNCQCIFLSHTVSEVDEQSEETIQYNRIIPALILLDLDDTMLHDININSTIYLCGLTTEIENGTIKYSMKECTENSPLVISSNEIEMSNDYKVNLLRFRINDYTLLTGEQNLILHYGDNLLTEFEDYSVMQIVNTNDINAEKGYDITIKSDFLIKHLKQENKLQVNYNCSQLSTSIYLDAIQILKENAYPKVTYSIDPNLMYKDFFYTDYNALNKIAFINDHELEFNQVQGYISDVTINLDKPWEDTIEVKNYKNKFEDIFSTIVAQTESMEKSEVVISSVGNAVNIDGSFSVTNLQSTLSKITIKYTLSNGTISLNKQDGILSSGSNGVISIKPDGIFYGPTVSSWSPAINANGINAAAITWGILSINNFKLTGESFNLVSSDGFVSNHKIILNEDSTVNGSISINDGLLISKKYSYTTDNNQIIRNTVSDLSILDGLFTSQGYSYIINNGETTQTIDASLSILNGVLTSGTASLNNGTLTINSASNLIIGNDNLESYILGQFTNDDNTWVSHGRFIPIQNVSIGQFALNRGVYVENSQLRLGTNTDPLLLYTRNNAQDQLYIKNLQLKCDSGADHIITFINEGQNAINYKIKITSSGLFYSLDNGTNWNQVAIVTPEPEPEP